MRWLPPATAAALGLYQLGEPSLWVDEAFTWRSTTDQAPRLAEELHALYYLALKPWVAIAGTSEVALRLPSVVFAVLATVLLYGLTRRLFDEATALVAALLLAVNPFMVQWSQQARSYTLLLCLVIASTWLLVRAMDDGRRVSWVEYGLALGTMILVQWFSAFLVLAAQALLARRSRSFWLTLAVTVLVASPWLASMTTRREGMSPTDWIEFPTVTELARASLLVPGAVGAGLVLAVVGAFLCRDWRSFLLAWAFGPFALTVAASFVEPVFVRRYLLVSVPAFAILGAVGLNRLARPMRVAAAGGVAIGTVAALIVWYSPDPGENWVGENWRAATRRVEGRALVVPQWALPAFHYYGGVESSNGMVIERAEGLGVFAPAPGVEAFGTRLRVLHR
jgi:mannosyltransferase